jgi:hypothetical protein
MLLTVLGIVALLALLEFVGNQVGASNELDEFAPPRKCKPFTRKHINHWEKW